MPSDSKLVPYQSPNFESYFPHPEITDRGAFYIPSIHDSLGGVAAIDKLAKEIDRVRPETEKEGGLMNHVSLVENPLYEASK